MFQLAPEGRQRISQNDVVRQAVPDAYKGIMSQAIDVNGSTDGQRARRPQNILPPPPTVDEGINTHIYTFHFFADWKTFRDHLISYHISHLHSMLTKAQSYAKGEKPAQINRLPAV